MTDGSTPTYRFSGLRGHLLFGVAGGAAQVAGGLLSLRAARRRDRGAAATVRAAATAAGGLLFAAAAISARRGGVRLGEDRLSIDLGWWWRGSIPYEAIADVVEVEHPAWAGFGVRTDLRRWLALVLWGRRVPALVFGPPRRLPLLWFLPLTALRVRQLRLGLEGKEAFAAAVRARLSIAARRSHGGEIPAAEVAQPVAARP